jgi:RNA 2',3'-cyclic 3'-phosphodiesterase
LPPAAPAGSARLFVALWPGPRSRAALAEARGRWQWPPLAAPVPSERLHLTLHFLGAVPRERLGALADAIAAPFRAFDLVFGHDELWPHGIAVLCPERTPQPLRQLHGDLGEALLRLGLQPEARPWRPHVTLARHAAGALAPPAAPAWRWPVRGYALVESDSRPRLSYRVLRRYA